VRVLGVDPGTATLGYGVVEADARGPARLVECGVVRTRAGDALPARLRIIHDGITGLLARHRPDAVAVESAFYGKNVRTTLVLGHARGVILLAAEQAGLPVAEYDPRMVKKAVTGQGAALKPQVAYMVAQLLRLKAPPAPSDAADGVAIALTHLLRLHGPRATAAARATTATVKARVAAALAASARP
jgi:crossover junction endodeoxyribonuclease RuvC